MPQVPIIKYILFLTGVGVAVEVALTDDLREEGVGAALGQQLLVQPQALDLRDVRQLKRLHEFHRHHPRRRQVVVHLRRAHPRENKHASNG